MSDAGSGDEEQREEGPSIGIYEGDRNAQKQRHGRGKNIFPNKDVYEGTYVNGKREGTGTYSFHSGARYTGGYHNNLREGKGRLVYPDGSRYSGDWKQGKRNGVGIYWYANGDKHQGEWLNDQKHGSGTYTFASSGSQKKGVWENGTLLGPGQIVHADHTIKAEFVTNEHIQAPATVLYHSTGFEQVIDKIEPFIQQLPMPEKEAVAVED
ncbi:MAG: hypothetical protein BJ554DRAFT_7044 [Olpidium bornovanus]|uniref:Uncharacterized protein n=1 Tax=Olpidium bornovanus TaxID=278681 RepID=A0A8H7ZWH7_9FUNG|nr:MAG: hypothetical protein BJ554DRAFT_7044 [Olpidium bornovanus]